MQTYLRLLEDILQNGELREDRTNTGTFALFGYRMEFDLEEGFPLVTTKKLYVDAIIHELLWFLKGDTTLDYLHKNKVTIWDEWASKGQLGRIYGAQWRDWYSPEGSVDQIQQLIEGIQANPFSRRHIVTAWNPGEIQHMSLPPCHILFQLYVDNNHGLHCQLYQRSADVFLGVPFNIASYALLTHLIAKVTNLRAKRFIWVGGDVHLYTNHIMQAKKQLQRIPRKLPQLKLANKETIFDFIFTDIQIQKYDPHPHIKAPIAV